MPQSNEIPSDSWSYEMLESLCLMWKPETVITTVATIMRDWKPYHTVSSATDARAEYQAEAARADHINQLRRFDED